MNYALASTLGKLQTQVYWLHDAEKFDELAETVAKLYHNLGYEQKQAEIAGGLISKAYQLADEAELARKADLIDVEIQFYNQAKENFLQVENTLGLQKSIAEYQMKWWIYFRHRNYIKIMLNLFFQHFKQLGFINVFTAIKLTYYMLQICNAHNQRNIELSNKNTTKYWTLLLKYHPQNCPYIG
jgi:hypothetical protein